MPVNPMSGYVLTISKVLWNGRSMKEIMSKYV